MFSIKRRLLLVGSTVILFFLLITAFALEKAFRSVADQARDERLHANIYTLLAAADLDGDSLQLPEMLPEQRLMLPDSGLYAYVLDNNHTVIWSSPSAIGLSKPQIELMSPGEEMMNTINSEKELQILQFGVSWQSYDQKDYQFTIAVIEDSKGYNQQIASYRKNLYGWLAALVVVLVVVQIYILRWGLSPLAKVERDISDIESGKNANLDGNYPKEINGITRNLNILIENERRRQKQYQDTLANLAHSLKTPLAVLKNEVDARESNSIMIEQVDRINSMVEYQLSRAALSGRITYTSAIKVLPIAEKLISALDKVFVDKKLICVLECNQDIQINAVEGDLMEILGNLLENAYKWSKTTINVRISQLDEAGSRIQGIKIVIDDDGPGINQSSIENILIRGGRADTTTPGHGIGLAVVKDLVDSYMGILDIGVSPVGGASISIEIPPR